MPEIGASKFVHRRDMKAFNDLQNYAIQPYLDASEDLSRPVIDVICIDEIERSVLDRPAFSIVPDTGSVAMSIVDLTCVPYDSEVGEMFRGVPGAVSLLKVLKQRMSFQALPGVELLVPTLTFTLKDNTVEIEETRSHVTDVLNQNHAYTETQPELRGALIATSGSAAVGGEIPIGNFALDVIEAISEQVRNNREGAPVPFVGRRKFIFPAYYPDNFTNLHILKRESVWDIEGMLKIGGEYTDDEARAVQVAIEIMLDFIGVESLEMNLQLVYGAYSDANSKLTDPVAYYCRLDDSLVDPEEIGDLIVDTAQSKARKMLQDSVQPSLNSVRVAMQNAGALKSRLGISSAQMITDSFKKTQVKKSGKNKRRRK